MQTQQTDIAIIGSGLTGLTTAFHLIKKGRSIRIIEKDKRTGGQMHTCAEDGFVFESGPNTGSVSHPEVAELFAALSPACEMETADDNANRRLIWKGNRFRTLPSGLTGGITTPLFSWYDKFRILGEPFRSRGTNPDETVGELACRRLGKSFLDYAVDPFISGIYAGDPMSLVTRYALPKLYNLEQTYGGFIKGSIAKARQAKTERERLATKKVFAAKGGFSRLTSALAEAIGPENIRLSAASVSIRPSEDHWLVSSVTPAGETICLQAACVVTTVGAYALPALLPFLEEEQLRPIVNLRYAPVVQAAVGVKDTRGLRFKAFGGLVPSCEKKDLLGILFPSACFKGRAPEEGAIFSFFIGGIRSAQLTHYSDEALQELVMREFHAMLQFPPQAAPDMIRLFRHPQAIPQYEQNAGERFAAIERIQHAYPGLILAGNIRNGISMADRILQAATISREL
jgi:oxygen-dependent protoporphyrinogen oxidase